MIGLIRKDFYLNRKIIFAFLTMCLIYAVIMTIASIFIRTQITESPINVQFFSVINTAMFFLCAMSVQSIMAQADMGRKTRYYFCASPVGIKGFVASKYYACFLINFFVFLYCELYDLLLSAIYGTLLNNSLLHVALLFAAMTLQSITLPFFIGFGKHGQHFQTAIILILCICGAIYALFGDISPFMKKDGILSILRNVLEHTDTESIMTWILGAAYPLLVGVFLTPHLMILLIYVSYRISCALFRRGAMTYEA